MPMVDSLISEVAPQRALLQAVAVARDLQCKSDCHSAQESTVHCVHLSSRELLLQFVRVWLENLPFAGQLVKWETFWSLTSIYN